MVFIIFFLVGCASSDEPVSKAHSATYSMDLFQVEPGMPVREVKKQKFYYKHCELNSRHAFTSKAEYSCNEK